ncbi:MAG: hypothetical protein ACNS62_22380 [Candidatus Cyclobacteriaceae bacterium M3_2C_046]
MGKHQSYWFNLLLFLWGTAGMAQPTDQTKAFRGWFNDHYQEISLHLDKPYYISGELMQFKIYLLQNPSQNIYYGQHLEVYLVDAEGKVREQGKVKLHNQVASSGFYIPEQLSTGYYRLMIKSSSYPDPGLVFENIIPVIHPSLQDANPEPQKETKVNLSLFPEGGNMVSGYDQKIGVFVTDQSGQGVQTRGMIFDQDSTSITSFETDSLGLGWFSFKPADQRNYAVLIKTSQDSTFQSFRLPRPAGRLTMRVNQQQDNLEVTIFPSQAGIEKHLLAFVKDGHLLELKPANNTHHFKITNWEPGVYKVWLINSEKEVVAYRNFQLVNDQVLKPVWHMNSNTFSNREPVNIRFEMHDARGNPVAVDYSVSIRKKALLSGHLETAWSGHLIKQITQVSSQHQVNDMLLFSHPPHPLSLYDHEKQTEGLSVRGQVTGNPYDVVISLISPTLNPVFRYTSPDNQGNFIFPNLDFEGESEFYIKGWSIASDESVSLNIQSQQDEVNFSPIQLPPLKLDQTMLDYVKAKATLRKIDQTFNSFQVLDMRDQNVKPDVVKGHPDLKIDTDDVFYLDDYVTFSNMTDVMREIVLGVMLREKKAGYKIRMLDRRTKYYFKKEPLILLDGIPISSETLMNLNPDEILAIATARPIDNFYDFGPLGLHGVLLVYTRDRSSRPVPSANLTMVKKRGYLPQPLLPEISFANKENHIKPDFRPLLYWQSQDDQDNSFDFYTSDDVGVYKIIIKGKTLDGTWWTVQKELNIVPGSTKKE